MGTPLADLDACFFYVLFPWKNATIVITGDRKDLPWTVLNRIDMIKNRKIEQKTWNT